MTLDRALASTKWNLWHGRPDRALDWFLDVEMLMYNFAETYPKFKALVKQKTRAVPGFKTFRMARATILGVELVHMIRKGQVRPLPEGSAAEQFYALAA